MIRSEGLHGTEFDDMTIFRVEAGLREPVRAHKAPGSPKGQDTGVVTPKPDSSWAQETGEPPNKAIAPEEPRPQPGLWAGKKAGGRVGKQ